MDGWTQTLKKNIEIFHNIFSGFGNEAVVYIDLIS